MSRNSGNVSKTKKLISGVANNSKHNRKSYKKLSDSSSISSNRNSSAHSEEDVRLSGVYLRPQVDINASYEEQEQVTKKFQAQVKELRHKLRVLEESVDSKDYSLGTIAREKDRAIGEIRRLERSNKLLRQQLNDERNHYLEEKERFCEEMTRYKKKLQEVKSDTDGGKKTAPPGRQPLINQSLRWQLSKEKGDFVDPKSFTSQKTEGIKEKDSTELPSITSDSQIRKPSSIESLHLYKGDDVSLQMAALRTENAKLRSIICERDERNYELCLRFLRMKHYKNDIKDRFHELENEYLQVIANLMDKIDEARQEFNFIIDQKFKRPMHSTNAMYLHMVQKNSRMAFENASLRLENQCLKKELNKYMNGSSDFERKSNQVAPLVEDIDSKVVEEKKGEGKLKRIKKNVNFKEIRTIYERDFTFKNSDTDSNYMSKTSTTVPSNGSLRDPKSNESITKEERDNQTQSQANLKKALPDEILNKIFKRVDSSSCQTLTSGKPSKPEAKPKEEIFEIAILRESDNTAKNTERKPSPEKLSRKKSEPVIIEPKSSNKLINPLSPCESKEFAKYEEVKETAESKTEEKEKSGKAEKEDDGRYGRQKNATFTDRLRSRVRCDWHFEKESEEGSSSLDFPLRRFTFVGSNLSGRQQKDNRGRSVQKRARHRTTPFHDSCGLQEKLDFSDSELPPSGPAGKQIQTVKPSKRTGEATARGDLVESEDEDSMRGKFGRPQRLENLTPAIGSRSRSSNKVNLQDELMEAKIRQFTETPETGKEPDLATQKKPEASKRFSHRLFSTSPQQLRNILTESQLQPFQAAAPVVVSHATTEMVPAYPYERINSEIFLQLVIPPSPKRSALFSDTETTERPILPDKEASASEISPVRPTKSCNRMDTNRSGFQIAVPSLPTSNSTMEIIDSAVRSHEWGSALMRTLSAPGLLESNWLDPYTICEMRDCGTNT